jgi:hypothetical protein
MYIKKLVEDECFAAVTDTSQYPCGYEINRCGFSDENEAKKAIEIYAKTGVWPNQVKQDTEKDV